MMIARRMVLLLGVMAAAGASPNEPAGPDVHVVAQFQKECATRAEAAEKTDSMTIVGKDGWLFLAGELRHVSAGKFWGDDAPKASAADKPENADPLPAILDFKAQLDRAGIHLILLPVPPKAIIYPEKLSDAVVMSDGKLPRMDVEQREFYQLLREKGVNVLDLTPLFLAHRLDAEGAVYCKQDTHWSGRACVLAADQIAELIKNDIWLKAMAKSKFASQTRTLEIRGDLLEGIAGAQPPRETISLTYVGTQNGSELTPVPTDRSSPILLLGDSHNLVFHSGGDMHAEGAGLADQLALRLGIPADLIAVRGSGATPARINLLRLARSDPSYLAKKKVVIWCFSAREFTRSSGWQKVPVVK